MTYPILASGALHFAFEKATIEGKLTIGVLCVVSLVSWTVIISKTRQLLRARKMTRLFFEAYRATRDPLELFRKEESFAGAPANEVYYIGAEELNYHIINNPVKIPASTGESGKNVAASSHVRISAASFDIVKVALERAVGTAALNLEKGMIVLSTAVAGGPFIGLLGTVWGVMETFSGIAKANAASLTAMAPGVAGALIATVIGLMVAIPAMFAYNFMVTNIRAFTQELDNFATEFATSIQHKYVDNRSVADELVDALQRSKSQGKSVEELIR